MSTCGIARQPDGRFPGLPASVEVIDCVGTSVPAIVEEGSRIINVNEVIKYIVAPPDKREELKKAIDQIEVVLELNEQNVR